MQSEDIPNIPSPNQSSDMSSENASELPSTGGCGVGQGYDVGDGFRFSAKTCLSVLERLTEDELDDEINFIKAYHSDLSVRTRVKGVESKRAYLESLLNKTFRTENDKIVNNLNLVLDSISDIRNQTPQPKDVCTEQIRHQEQAKPANTSSGNRTLPQPVSDTNISLSDYSYEDVAKYFTFTDKLSGNRSTCYYGEHPYGYGNTKHQPQPYPSSCPLFDEIFAKISEIDSSFTKSNFSCLVTNYPDGKSYIPSHSDDEKSIAPNSNIYTISFGSERKFDFVNQVGKLQPTSKTLCSGSVVVMTAESQKFWKHEIKPEPLKSEPRISLTFRNCTPPTVPPTSTTPTPDTRSNDSPKRVLLITDSILSGTPPHILSPTNHICVKKINYQLENVLNFEDEFGVSDQVIFSGGVNDLQRYNHTADSLADTLSQRIINSCRAHPKTQFIFNSVLLTKFDNLNKEILKFNGFMRDVCSRVANLNYFDSHNVLITSGIRNVINSNGNGIHITFEARKAVTKSLATKLRLMAKSTGSTRSATASFDAAFYGTRS